MASTPTGLGTSPLSQFLSQRCLQLCNRHPRWEADGAPAVSTGHRVVSLTSRRAAKCYGRLAHTPPADTHPLFLRLQQLVTTRHRLWCNVTAVRCHAPRHVSGEPLTPRIVPRLAASRHMASTDLSRRSALTAREPRPRVTPERGRD